MTGNKIPCKKFNRSISKLVMNDLRVARFYCRSFWCSLAVRVCNLEDEVTSHSSIINNGNLVSLIGSSERTYPGQPVAWFGLSLGQTDRSWGVIYG